MIPDSPWFSHDFPWLVHLKHPAQVGSRQQDHRALHLLQVGPETDNFQKGYSGIYDL